MNEHNTNFYSLENIKETLESCKDFLDGEEVYYHIGTLRYAYEEIERLNNIIKNLDKMFEYYFLGNLKYDQNTVNTIYIKYVKLKELKEGK